MDVLCLAGRDQQAEQSNHLAGIQNSIHSSQHWCPGAACCQKPTRFTSTPLSSGEGDSRLFEPMIVPFQVTFVCDRWSGALTIQLAPSSNASLQVLDPMQLLHNEKDFADMRLSSRSDDCWSSH
eukprot:702478-Pelagomonas_calceolata.AAC.1